ncbi:MAG TPA: hypothetical protein VGK74_01700 [Symbiobacteriaceae bacterium]|jgi:hypothetical protein
MQEIMTAAQALALANGAAFSVTTGVLYDPAGAGLSVLVPVLQERLRAIGVSLEAVRREGDTLIATVREDEAGEPLCPAAFRQVVRAESHRLLGEALDGRFVVAAPAPALRVAALVA